VTGRLLTATEVAERLAVPVSWVRESTRSGAMPCVRLGRYVRFEQAEVEAWLEGCRQPGARSLFGGWRASDERRILRAA
jgi:excisionase family DNA binding protein